MAKDLHQKTIPIEQHTFRDNHESNAGFSYKLMCINETSQDITMVMRDNVMQTYDRVNDNGIACKQKFIIRKIYQFQNNQVINNTVVNLYNLLGHVKDTVLFADAQKVYEELMTAIKMNNSVKSLNITIDRVISLKELSDIEYCYLSEVDLMLYLGKYNRTMLHPHSVKAKTYEVFNEVKDVQLTTGILFQLVANDNKITNRYISLCGDVVKLPISNDVDRADGLYISRIHANGIDHDYSSLEDMAERYNVYADQESARTAGQPDIIHKTNLKSLEENVEIIKRENLIEKLEKERKLLEHQREQIELEFEKQIEREKREREKERERDERERQRVERERQREEEQYDLDKKREREQTRLKQEHEETMARIKQESAQMKKDHEEELLRMKKKEQEMKDFYEDRSANRKDNSETIKNVGLTIAAGVAILALIQKNK